MTDLPFPRGTIQLSGSEIRRLRELREQVKVASVLLPMPVQRRLLVLLEQSRPWKIPPRPVPEMTRGELIRAIRWRLGTVPLDGVSAAAQFVAQHRPRRRPAAAPAPPSPPPRSFRRRRS
ncbi:MAG TPA: hypothetical protein VNA31_05760 [bacterium]|nr:hypothetical protein [bacterium]